MSTVKLLYHIVMMVFLAVGFWDVLYNYEPNQCEMTYMYQMPQYKKIEVYTSESFSDSKNDRYGLYLYGEGHYFAQIQSLKLQGIPVLFIPGHGGSYKQARSLGSILLKKVVDKSFVTHFNVFTVDLNEELVGFYGGTLHDQMKFIHYSIKKILTLYEQVPVKPTSVVLVGHSMGGILARGLFTLDDFDPNMVSTIITLATPNLAPVINIDHMLDSFYKHVNNYWNSSVISNVTVVSISGGFRDFHVRSSIAKLPINNENVFTTSAPAIPYVQVSADHQCIVWCKQLVQSITRFLFEIVDSSTKQVSNEVTKRNQAMAAHFNLTYSDKSIRKVKLSKQYTWKNVSSLLWSLDRQDAGKGTYYSFYIKDFTNIHAPHLVSRSDSKRDNWILACKSVANEGRCTNAIYLSHLTTTSPAYNKVIHINLEHLSQQGYDYVLFPSSKNMASKIVDVNILSSLEIKSVVPVPHVFSNMWSLGNGFNYVINDYPEKGRFYYQLHLRGFSSIYQAFNLELLNGTSNFKIDVPWDNSQTFNGKNLLHLKLQSTSASEPNDVIVHLFLEDDQPVTINIKVDFFQVLGQIFRHLGVVLPTFIVANILFVHCYQIKQMYAGMPCHSIADAHSIYAKPYKVQPFVSLLKVFLGFPIFATGWYTIGLPVPDVLILEGHKEWFSFAPMVLFLFAVEILTTLFRVQKLLIYAIAKMIRYMPIKWTSVCFEQSYSRALFHSAILSVLLQVASPIAFLYMFLASLLHACWLYNSSRSSHDSVTANVKSLKGQTSESSNDDEKTSSLPASTTTAEDRFSVYFILTQMWMWLLIFSVPTLIVLVVNFSSSLTLPRDPMLNQCVVSSFLFVLQTIQPSHDGIASSRIKFISKFYFPVTVFCVLFSMHSLYRVPWFIISFLTAHTLSQIL